MFRSILTIMLTTILFACGGGGSDKSFSVPGQTADNCPTSMQCNFFNAPKDYNNDNGETVKIYYGIHKATDIENRIGILVFNYGGPGGEAVSSTGWMINNSLPPEILARFDVIGMDPRGAGQSAFAKEFTDCAVAGNCNNVLADIAPYAGSNSVVKDLEQLRQVLGEDKLNFMGYSYGTRLGALYAKMFPENVRAIVLDSPMSPDEANFFETIKGKIQGSDLVVDYRLGFDATYKSKYIDVFNSVVDSGYYTAGDGVILNYTEADAVLSATSDKEHTANWSMIKNGVFELLDNNNAQQLKELIPSIYYPAPTTDDLRFNMLFMAVSCTDEAKPLSYNEILAKQPEYDAISTLFAPFAKDWSTMCADWPYLHEPIATVESMENVLSGQQILIIAGKYDTNTPYFWGQQMAASFGELASVITIDDLADHGFSYTGLSCVDKNTTQYLLDPTLKIADETCSGAILNKNRSLATEANQHPAKRINKRRYQPL